MSKRFGKLSERTGSFAVQPMNNKQLTVHADVYGDPLKGNC